MSTTYNYPQPYQSVDQHHYHHQHSHSASYYQPAIAPQGYYQAQYVPQNVPAPVYHHQPAPVMQQQMYAPAPMMPAPAHNPYVPANAYGYNNSSQYYQVAQPQVQQHMPQHAVQQPQVQQQENAEQPVTGGVSSVLDYDLTMVSKFSAYLALRLFSRDDTDNMALVNRLKSVLSATRLPLSSIILANYFLVQKYELDSRSFHNNSDEIVFQVIVISLVLANKANDDNTFTNKSWSDATTLNVRLINFLEVNWLNLIDWKLHDVNMERFEELKAQYEKFANNHISPKSEYSRQVREPISPILQSSPSSRDYKFNTYSQWYNDYTPTTPSAYNYKSYSPEYGYHKSYPYNDCCLRTGSYQKLITCDCNYCASSPIRRADWSTRMKMTAAC